MTSVCRRRRRSADRKCRRRGVDTGQVATGDRADDVSALVQLETVTIHPSSTCLTNWLTHVNVSDITSYIWLKLRSFYDL